MSKWVGEIGDTIVNAREEIRATFEAYWVLTKESACRRLVVSGAVIRCSWVFACWYLQPAGLEVGQVTPSDACWSVVGITIILRSGWMTQEQYRG